MNYLETYRNRLLETLLRQCTSAGLLSGELLRAEELNDKWRRTAPDYMADAVPQIPDYPAAAIAWACYVGMGAAAVWDTDWDSLKNQESIYPAFAAPRGFDCLDEYVLEELLRIGTDSEQARKLNETILGCSRQALTLIRKEGFEAQSREAFHIFAATVTLFFEVGVSLELFRRGYKYMKVTVPIHGPVQ